MANKLKPKLLKLLIKLWLLYFDQGIQGTRFPAKGIGYHISLTRMVMNTDVIILDKLHPSSLPHVQLLLREYILQALMVGVDFTMVSDEIVLPCFEGMDNGS
jgi:hypothetical protein